jgi:hypothetical protein
LILGCRITADLLRYSQNNMQIVIQMEALLSTKPLQHTHVILKFEFVMLVSPVWKIFVRSVFIISN